MKLKNISRASEKGLRSYQEDRYAVSHNAYGTLLAVFDGHGGDFASDYCEQNFVQLFLKGMDARNDPRWALGSVFVTLANALRYYQQGTTASAVFIPEEGDVVYTAVLGDSPIIAGGGDLPPWFGPDHNVRSNPAEADAAIERGGFIHGGYLCKSYDGGGLQMGRALGDAFLGKVLSNEPEIDEVLALPGDFILVATDGLFDPSHHNFKEAAQVILDKIEQGEPAEGLVKVAIEARTGDNATAILARIE